MVAPIRYLSRRVQEQKIGILQNTEEIKVLEVVGRVGIGTTIFDADYNLDVRGTANVTGILSVGQIISGAGNTFSDLTVTGVSTFQNPTRFADGTEALPSISFINDTDLGLYRPADNEIAFTNGGSERIRIDSNGSVGIGTTLPSQKLDVNGNVNIRGELHGPEVFIIDPAAVGDNTGAVRIKGDLYVDGENFIIDSETITLADFVVGIASTVPSDTLLDGAGIGIGSLSPGGQHYHTFLYRFNSGNGLLQSSEHLSVANDKCYFIGSTERLCADTLSLGTGTTIHSPASNVLTFGTNSEERIRIDDQGRVGIGSTQPSQKLDVNGNVAIGGSVYDANNLPGNNGQVLSNVTGFGISWTDAPVGEVNVNDITSGSYYIGAFETTGTTSQAYIETTNPVVITSDGRIGIGSTLPTQKLDVSGSVAISDFIYDSTGSTGSPGQVLKSTVSGTQWENETGGTGTTIGIRSDGTIVGTASTVDFYDSFNVVVNSGIASIRISDIDAGSFI